MPELKIRNGKLLVKDGKLCITCCPGDATDGICPCCISGTWFPAPNSTSGRWFRFARSEFDSEPTPTGGSGVGGLDPSVYSIFPPLATQWPPVEEIYRSSISYDYVPGNLRFQGSDNVFDLEYHDACVMLDAFNGLYYPPRHGRYIWNNTYDGDTPSHPVSEFYTSSLVQWIYIEHDEANNRCRWGSRLFTNHTDLNPLTPFYLAVEWEGPWHPRPIDCYAEENIGTPVRIYGQDAWNLDFSGVGLTINPNGNPGPVTPEAP